MDVNVFDVANDIKELYEHSGNLKALQKLFSYNKLDVNMERSEEGAIKIKTTHPIRVYTKNIYNILLGLNFIRSVDLRIDFTYNGEQKNVSKRFGPSEDIDEIIDDLLGLPHDKIIDISVDTDAFKITEIPGGTYDEVNIILKKGNSKALFKTFLVRLFPIINMTVEKNASMTISFQKENEDEITVDVSPSADGINLGVKSIKIRLL